MNKFFVSFFPQLIAGPIVLAKDIVPQINKMKDEKDKYFGRDEYQNPVIVHSKKNIISKEKRVLIKNFSQHTIYGELIDNVNHLAA